MYLLQTHNFSRGRLTHRIRHNRKWRKLSGSHSLHVEPSYTRRKQTRGEHIGRPAAKESVNHLLHSMFNQIDVYLNQKLVSLSNNTYAYRALLNYFAGFTRKNFLSNFLLKKHGYSWLHRRHVKFIKSKYGAPDTRAIHSGKSCARFHRLSLLRHFQSR